MIVNILKILAKVWGARKIASAPRARLRPMGSTRGAPFCSVYGYVRPGRDIFASFASYMKTKILLDRGHQDEQLLF